MIYTVGVISYSDALALNEGLDDDNKPAFQNKEGTMFMIKDPNQVSTTLPISKYEIKTISTEVAEGSFPVTKKLRIYP